MSYCRNLAGTLLLLLMNLQSERVFDPAPLITEVEVLHRSLMGRSPPAKVVEGYLQAHVATSYFQSASPVQQKTVETIVVQGLSAGGIEYALRLRCQGRHLLTRKMLLLCYLCECDGEHDEFMRKAPGFWRGWLELICCGLAMLAVIVRGYFQRWWYGLA